MCRSFGGGTNTFYMYNTDTVVNNFLSKIAWLQNDDSAGLQLDTNLTSGNSGFLFNEGHAYLTFDNLRSFSPEFDKIAGISDADVKAKFSEWVRRNTRTGIKKAIDKWMTAKVKSRTSNNILQSERLFDYRNRSFYSIDNNSKEVGYRINTINSKSLIVSIDRIALQFTQNQNVRIKLKKLGDASFEKTEALNYIASGSVQWFALTDWEIDSSSIYFITYEQSEITGNALDSVDVYRTNRRFSRCAKFVQFAPFSADSIDIDGKNSLSITPTTNWGLNFDISVRCDYTNFIVDNDTLFYRLVVLGVADQFLREFIYNPTARENRNKKTLDKNNVLYELNGNPQGRKYGIGYEIEQELDKIMFDKSQIDQICLTCKRTGVRYRSV